MNKRKFRCAHEVNVITKTFVTHLLTQKKRIINLSICMPIMYVLTYFWQKKQYKDSAT